MVLEGMGRNLDPRLRARGGGTESFMQKREECVLLGSRASGVAEDVAWDWWK